MKKIAQLLMVSLTVVGLSACGTSNTTSQKKPAQQTTSQEKTSKQNNIKPTPINWRKPSEDKPYPKITAQNGRYLYVSIANQRVYILSPKKKVLYTMNASTGKNNSTPRGTYHIQEEHGDFFYNQESKEGAKYWTSFKDHGIYLFHTVPTDAQGNYIPSEARELGRSANSHGCVRLAIPDAKWINQNVPVGTKVVIN
ncbi:L,D-transpeptidase [Lentilactobacillus kosonis]|uniref:D-alanyl-D-alanine carboxypeptidase n=1 Tax=Lentilactobacillus kosonis TaxID=2810561 RepID=A0A401FJQ6_9LACO|nr:L,D-transpeptidase [Lentilactobacillus kosonis]GAY72567.1 D-alanyl-D-alanine carboxypeptidase [Lentilactobacillus kosonis]